MTLPPSTETSGVCAAPPPYADKRAGLCPTLVVWGEPRAWRPTGNVRGPDPGSAWRPPGPCLLVEGPGALPPRLGPVSVRVPPPTQRVPRVQPHHSSSRPPGSLPVPGAQCFDLRFGLATTLAPFPSGGPGSHFAIRPGGSEGSVPYFGIPNPWLSRTDAGALPSIWGGPAPPPSRPSSHQCPTHAGAEVGATGALLSGWAWQLLEYSSLSGLPWAPTPSWAQQLPRSRFPPGKLGAPHPRNRRAGRPRMSCSRTGPSP